MMMNGLSSGSAAACGHQGATWDLFQLWHLLIQTRPTRRPSQKLKGKQSTLFLVSPCEFTSISVRFMFLQIILDTYCLRVLIVDKMVCRNKKPVLTLCVWINGKMPAGVQVSVLIHIWSHRHQRSEGTAAESDFGSGNKTRDKTCSESSKLDELSTQHLTCGLVNSYNCDQNSAV